METVVAELKSRFVNHGLRSACQAAYQRKQRLLQQLGLDFTGDNPRILIEASSKEEQLWERLKEYPDRQGYCLSAMFGNLLEINGISRLRLDQNNNIVMPSGLAIRLSVFTKHCQDSTSIPYFDWQDISSFNLGSGLYLTIHPVDFANCSNQKEGITSWISCFSPCGIYAGAPYACINSPHTLMVMKGKPDKMQGRMWLHLLTEPEGGKPVVYALMCAYGACFTDEERERIRLTLSEYLHCKFVATESCRIVTNNEISTQQKYNIRTNVGHFYVYFDPIERVYLAEGFTLQPDQDLSLSIGQPFDEYGEATVSCREFSEQDGYADDNLSYCTHCDAAYSDEDGEGRWLDNYDRCVCSGCLDALYAEIGDNYIWQDDVVEVFEVNYMGDPETCSEAESHDDSNYEVDSYEADCHDIAIAFDNDLGEYVPSNCLLYCAECGKQHADYRIYEFLEATYPCAETEEPEPPRERETRKPKESETIMLQMPAHVPQYYVESPNVIAKEA